MTEKLTPNLLRSMTWDEMAATTVEQRREYAREVMLLEVTDDEDVPVGLLCWALPHEVTAVDKAAGLHFLKQHLGDLRG